jgi:hypothetical protein
MCQVRWVWTSIQRWVTTSPKVFSAAYVISLGFNGWQTWTMVLDHIHHLVTHPYSRSAATEREVMPKCEKHGQIHGAGSPCVTCEQEKKEQVIVAANKSNEVWDMLHHHLVNPTTNNQPLLIQKKSEE